uniref:EGF-like domain-containing protein n=1 Tax=Plectus sambesii TaxID=2011161 RepID=A0A914VFY1_9BILA
GSCKCKSGFIGNGYNCSASCESNKCAKNAECIPDPTADMGYICRCPDGQSGDGLSCQQKTVDVCRRLQVECGNGTCLAGADETDDYTCVCSEGFKFQAGSCQDVDECSIADEELCATPWQCVNTYGSYECRCEKDDEVWNATARLCQKAIVQVSDCSVGQKICARKNAECADVKGVGYECKCRQGSKQNADGICFDKAQFELK